VVEHLQAVDDDGRRPAPDPVRVVVGSRLEPTVEVDQPARGQVLADELRGLAERGALVELGVLLVAAVGRDPERDLRGMISPSCVSVPFAPSCCIHSDGARS
jgi:hypothetical protein